VERPVAGPARWEKKSSATYHLHIDGISEPHFELFAASARLQITATRPFKLGDQAFTPKPPAIVDVDLAPYLGTLDLDGYHRGARAMARYHAHDKTPLPPESDHMFAVGAKLEVELESPWQPLQISLPPLEIRPQVASAILRTIATSGHGITFAGEPTKPRPDTMLIVFESDQPLDPLLGPGTHLEDIDWVAASTWKPTGKTHRCGGYSRVANVPGDLAVDVQLSEVEVTIFDRRTGRALGKKTFPPDGKCPEFAGGQAIVVGADTTAVVAWLEAQRARGSVAD
jgi:hypothetical protein